MHTRSAGDASRGVQRERTGPERDRRTVVTSRSFSKNKFLRKKILKLFPNTKFNDEQKVLQEESLIDFLSDAEQAIVALDPFTPRVLENLPKLRLISKYGVGYSNLDLALLEKHKITLACAQGVNRTSVAEFTLGLMLASLRRIPQSVDKAKRGVWKPFIGKQLSQLTVGIVGCGNIGTRLIELLQPFGTPVLAHDVVSLKKIERHFNVTQTPLDALLRQLDILTLHVPLDESTKNIMSRENLNKMKENSFLINTARGGLVDEEALYDLLKANYLSGAAFDVFLEEPPGDSPLFELDNFISTPHMGGSSEEAVLAMGHAAIEGLTGEHIILHGNG